MNVRIVLYVALLSGVLSLPAQVSLAQSGSCWRLSPPANNPCGAEMICVEWEDNGFPVASDCCGPGEVGTLGCFGHCRPAEIDRPVLTTPRLPGEMLRQGAPVSAALSKPLGSSPLPAEPASTWPLLRVVFEGVGYSPEAFAELAPSEVHYLFQLDDGSGHSALFAFADWTELTRALKEVDPPDSRQPAKTGEMPTLVSVTFFDGEMWQGLAGQLFDGRPLDFQDSSWHQQISSLRGSGPGWVTLFDQGGLKGSSLTLSTAWDRPSLKPFGWNNRAVSGFIWPGPTSLGPGAVPVP